MTRRLARDPARRCLPLPEWPAADRALWCAALAPGDLLEPGGARVGHAPATNRKVERGYGRWLAWLRHTGRLDEGQPPAARIAREAVAAYLRALAAHNGSLTRISRLEELHQAARVMDPQADWGWIRRLAGRVRARHVPVRDKRARLVGAEALFALGLALMGGAARRTTPRQRATQFRDGLVVALLAARPLRRRNLAGLRLGEHVVRRGPDWWLQVPGAETKTGTPIEMPWPEGLVPRLEAYLGVHRPVLAGLRLRWACPVGAALWVSGDGSPMTEMALYDRIVAHTRAAFGRGVNPHLFRDCAATSVARDDPEHVGVATALLGHRSRTTTERHYNQARGVEAVRRLQAVLTGLREGTLVLPDDPEEDG
jgi:integrase/recombinase XerD